MNSRTFLAAALSLLSAALPSPAATSAIPDPVVESFDSLPDALSSSWIPGPTVWTSSVSVVSGESGEQSEPLVWTAFNARRDAVDPANAPALALQSANAATKGWLQSGPIPTSLQRISFGARRVFSSRDFSSDLYVNGVKVLSLRSQNPTNQVDAVSVETVDPATGLPFAAPVTLFFSNSLASAGIAIDDIALTPHTLFVTFDKPASNNIVIHSGEFSTSEKEFDVTAIHNLPAPLPTDAAVTGLWTVTPDFAGGISDPTGATLSLSPAPEDAGKTFTLTYTATLSQPLPEESPEDPEDPPPESQESQESQDSQDPPDDPPPPAVATFVHSASCTLSVTLSSSPRFLDFEDVKTLNYNTNGGTRVSISGGNFIAQDFRKSTSREPAIGNVSLCGQYQSHAPAFLASEFAYPDGIGTVSFRYANYSTAAVHRTMTFVAQVRGEEDDDWSDLPDGTLVVTNHYDISDFEFRVNADVEANAFFRLLSTAGHAGSIAVIDNLAIRPFGSHAPVLLYRGTYAIPANEDWSACFCYTNPAPDTPYVWEWSVDPALPGLSCVTNNAENRLEFSAAARPATRATNILTVAVFTNGVKDQQLSVPLTVVALPSFGLSVPVNPCTNVVDVFTTNVVLYGGSTNFSVAWTAEPPFNGTNSVHNKSRFRVIDIEQTNTTTHLLTAVLTESNTKLAATNSVSITVVPARSDPPDPPPVDPDTPSVIVDFSADSLTVSNLVPGAVYTPFALTNLLSGDPIPAGPPSTAAGSSLVLPLTDLPSSSTLFLGVSHSSP